MRGSQQRRGGRSSDVRGGSGQRRRGSASPAVVVKTTRDCFCSVSGVDGAWFGAADATRRSRSRPSRRRPTPRFPWRPTHTASVHHESCCIEASYQSSCCRIPLRGVLQGLAPGRTRLQPTLPSAPPKFPLFPASKQQAASKAARQKNARSTPHSRVPKLTRLPRDGQPPPPILHLRIARQLAESLAQISSQPDAIDRAQRR